MSHLQENLGLSFFPVNFRFHNRHCGTRCTVILLFKAFFFFFFPLGSFWWVLILKTFCLQLMNIEPCLSDCNRNKSHPGHFHAPNLPVFCAYRTPSWLLHWVILAASPIAIWMDFAVFSLTHMHTLNLHLFWPENLSAQPIIGPRGWPSVLGGYSFTRCFTLLRDLTEPEGNVLSALIRSTVLG